MRPRESSLPRLIGETDSDELLMSPSVTDMLKQMNVVGVQNIGGSKW